MRKTLPNDTIGQGATTARPSSSEAGPSGVKDTVKDKVRAAADKAGDIAADAKSAVSETVAETVSGLGSDVHETARNLHEEAVDQISGAADDAAEHGKNHGRDYAMSFSRAFDAAGDSLEQDGHPGIAGYARAAGRGMSNAAEEIDQLQTARLTGRIESFMRERPLATAGLFALAGFAIVGALKATHPNHTETDDDEGHFG